MIARGTWAVIILTAFVVVYFAFVRPKLRKFPPTKPFYDSEERVWDRIKGYRTVVIAALGVILTEAPDILQAVSGLDLTVWVPDATAKRISQVIILIMVILRAQTNTSIGHKE